MTQPGVSRLGAPPLATAESYAAPLLSGTSFPTPATKPGSWGTFVSGRHQVGTGQQNRRRHTRVLVAVRGFRCQLRHDLRSVSEFAPCIFISGI